MEAVLDKTIEHGIFKDQPLMFLPHAFNYIISEELAIERNKIDSNKIEIIKNRIDCKYDTKLLVDKILKGVL